MSVVDTSSRLAANLRQAAHSLVSEFCIEPPAEDDFIEKPRKTKKASMQRALRLPQAHLLTSSDIVDLLLDLPAASTSNQLARLAGLPAELIMEWAYVRGQLTQAEATQAQLDDSHKPDDNIPTTAASHSSSSISTPDLAPPTATPGPQTLDSQHTSKPLPLSPSLNSTSDVPQADTIDATNDSNDQPSPDPSPKLASANPYKLEAALLLQECPKLHTAPLLARDVVAVADDTALRGSESEGGADQPVLRSTVDSAHNSRELNRTGATCLGQLALGREAAQSVDSAAPERSEEEVTDFGSEARRDSSVVKDMVAVGFKGIGGVEQKAAQSECVGCKRACDDRDIQVHTDSHKRARSSHSSSPTRAVF